jgi:hypothetical protein
MMEVKTIEKNGKKLVIISSNENIILDIATALDLVMSIKYEYDSFRIVINKEAFKEDFFILSTKFAGDIVQKFVTYDIKMAIVGDYSHYTSKPLKDFMYESNHGKDLYFVNTIEDGIERLSK